MEVYFYDGYGNPVARKGLVIPEFDEQGNLELIKLSYVTADNELHTGTFKPMHILALIRSFN
jgi:hypothetical protein